MQRTFDDIVELSLESKPDNGVSTSVEAFLVKKENGSIERDRDRVYAAISDSSNGVTVKELARRWCRSSNDISGRFTELADDGFIVNQFLGIDERGKDKYEKRDGCRVWRVHI